MFYVPYRRRVVHYTANLRHRIKCVFARTRTQTTTCFPSSAGKHAPHYATIFPILSSSSRLCHCSGKDVDAADIVRGPEIDRSAICETFPRDQVNFSSNLGTDTRPKSFGYYEIHIELVSYVFSRSWLKWEQTHTQMEPLERKLFPISSKVFFKASWCFPRLSDMSCSEKCAL